MRSILLLVLAVAAAFGQKLPPVDESATDPTFAAFRAKLLDTLRRKDVAGLLAAVDPKVRVSFGTEDGIASFRRYWKLDRPAQSKVWSELGTILRLGVTRDEPEFIGPYVFTHFPKTLDAYTFAAVIRPAAVLREKPAEASRKTATLQYDIVELPGPRRNGWVEARTTDGKSGWVRESEIRSPLDYRAFFEKKPGGWKLTAFLNGD